MAVCDHHHWMFYAPSCSLCMPIAMGPVRPERLSTTRAGTLEPHPRVPLPAIYPIEHCRRRLPTVRQDLGGLEPPAPGLTEQPDGARHFRRTTLAPEPDPHRHLPLAVRSHQQHNLHAPDRLPRTTRPYPPHRLRHPGKALSPGIITHQRAARRNEPLHKEVPEPSRPGHLLRENAAQGIGRHVSAQERYTHTTRPCVAIP